MTQGGATLKRDSGLSGSQPSCSKEKKTFPCTWARNEDTSSPPLSLPVSFSLPLKITKGFHFHDRSSTCSLEKTQKVQHVTVPSLLQPMCRLTVLYTLLHLPSLAWNFLPLNIPNPLLSSQFLLSCHLSKEAFPSPYLNLQPPPSNLVLPAPSPRFMCFSETCINLQPALYFTDSGVYGCLYPILSHCFFFRA